MNRSFLNQSFLVGSLALLTQIACTPKRFQVSKQEQQYLKLDSLQSSPKEIQALIQPYQTKLQTEMGEIIGQCPKELLKAQPDGSLGHWVAEATQRQALLSFPQTPANFTLLNYGGLRIPSLSQGPVKVGSIFELSPFDNFLVLIKVPDELMPQVWQHVLNKGGWPLSAEVQITSNQQGQYLDWQYLAGPKQTHYWIATSEYLANGGDNCDFFKNLEQKTSSLTLREVLIQDLRTNGSAQTHNTPRFHRE